MLLDTVSLITAYSGTKVDVYDPIKKARILFVAIELHWFSMSLLTFCFDLFVFKGLC